MTQIEPASLEDCRTVAAVQVISWQHAYKHLLPAAFLASLSIDEREATWRESVEKGRPQLLVAKEDGNMIGFVAFGPSRDKDALSTCGEIWAIYVAPSAWSQGAGRNLWLAAQKQMEAQGFNSVTLWVLAGNERGRKFYEAMGFKLDPDSTQEFILGGAPVDEVRYAFSLNDG